jgi:opacity protein-like surface antigen
MSLGGGIGYQVDDHFRVDLTGDYWFDSDFRGSTSGICGGAPCTSIDTSSVNAFLLLANAYVDLGTYNGITPYIGAGIGGAHVDWDNLRNEIPGQPPVEHEGAANWRFAYAVMAGASYCLTDKLKLDAGYRYSRIEGGRMFEIAPGNPGPGFDGASTRMRFAAVCATSSVAGRIARDRPKSLTSPRRSSPSSSKFTSFRLLPNRPALRAVLFWIHRIFTTSFVTDCYP